VSLIAFNKKRQEAQAHLQSQSRKEGAHAEIKMADSS
jgi:hypothetical protein